MQPVHFEGQRIVTIALKPVGDQQHHRALSQHPSRPLLVESVQRGGDARTARPVRHVDTAGSERLIGVAVPDGAGDVCEPRAK